MKGLQVTIAAGRAFLPIIIILLYNKGDHVFKRMSQLICSKYNFGDRIKDDLYDLSLRDSCWWSADESSSIFFPVRQSPSFLENCRGWYSLSFLIYVVWTKKPNKHKGIVNIRGKKIWLSSMTSTFIHAAHCIKNGKYPNKSQNVSLHNSCRRT